MKKTILTTLIAVAFAAGAFAQGSVTFNTSSASGRAIKFSADGTTNSAVNIAAGNPAQVGTYGQLNIASYAATLGTVLNVTPGSGIPIFDANWKIATGIAHQTAPFAGSVPSINMTGDASLGAPPNNLQWIVVGWSGNFADFNAAVAAVTPVALGWSGSALSGGALSWNQLTGAALSPAAMVVGAGGFNGLILAPVPEPGTIALGGLGIAALLAFRRRK